MEIQHWISHWMGTDGSSLALFWGGIGSCLGYLSIVGVLVRKHQCEVGRCYRISRHITNAGHHVCTRHAPQGAPSAEDVRKAHEEAS